MRIKKKFLPHFPVSPIVWQPFPAALYTYRQYESVSYLPPRPRLSRNSNENNIQIRVYVANEITVQLNH